jgi:hypothetical protein
MDVLRKSADCYLPVRRVGYHGGGVMDPHRKRSCRTNISLDGTWRVIVDPVDVVGLNEYLGWHGKDRPGDCDHNPGACE